MTTITPTAPVGTPGNDSYINPFVPTIPTAKTTISTSDTTSTPTSTAIVSSNTAQDHIDNSIVPTMQNGQQDTLAQQQARQANAGKPGFDIFGNPVAISNTGNAQTNSDGTLKTTSSLTPEETIANTPDSGNQWIYDTQGNRTQVPIGSTIPAGYSSTNPTISPSTPQADTTTDSSGNTYIQYTDGTYGKLDPSGNYAGTVPAKVFQDAKTASGLLDSITKAVSGTYPLTSSQQAQISSLQSQFQQLIKDQQTANANLTGGTTVAENLYGMGNTLTGLGEIKGTVDSGLAKIADLNSKMVSAVASMTDSFNKDNIANLKTAYDLYDAASKERQSEIDKIQTVAQKAVTAQTAANTSINEAMAKKYPDTTDPILPSDDAATRQTKLQTSPKYVQDSTIAAKLTPEQNKFWADMATTGVSLNGILPNLGIGAAAASAKLQIMQTIADNAKAVGLSAQDVANSILDKKSKATTYTKLQTQGSQLAAQEQKVESDFQLVKKAGAKIPANVAQSGIPFLQNWINTGTLGTTGNPALNNYLGLLTTSLTNYARVVAGQTGTAATTAQMNTEIQNILNKGLSISAVNDYIDNAAIPEMKNTVSGYDTTMKQLMLGMNQADGTLAANGGGIGVGDTSTSSGTNNTPITQVQTNPDGTLQAVDF